MEDMLRQLQQMQVFFTSGATKELAFRRQQLLQLKQALLQQEQEIYQALYTDLKKNREEVWITELGFVLAEINHALKHLHKWMKPKKTSTNLLNFPSKSYVLYEPLGVVLIIGPWNYPLQLLFTPLVGAIAAGNCVVLKPSEFAPATALVLQQIVQKAFSKEYINVMPGDGAVIIPQMMKAFHFDHVFYTGSTQVGTLIYQMAAEKLVPVTLELGGKSPCIVESDADIKVTAKRIALTKFSNAGQMCVAPDYLLVHQSIKEALINELKKNIKSFYQAEHGWDYHYGKIVNEKQFNRLIAYLQQGTIAYGGRCDAAQLFIEPTLLTNIPLHALVMQEEIFGPVLPILEWQQESEVYEVIAANQHPLALYVFTSSKQKAEKWVRSISFGGGCINNASWHLTNYHLPFGGVGNSGFGTYHGQHSFETFSHKKAIMNTPLWFDPSIKYPPFKGKLNLFKKIVK